MVTVHAELQLIGNYCLLDLAMAAASADAHQSDRSALCRGVLTASAGQAL